MKEEKRHVGRPTNEEVKERRNKKILKILLPIFILIIIVTIFIIKSGFLTKLNASVLSTEKSQKLDFMKKYNISIKVVNGYTAGEYCGYEIEYSSGSKVKMIEDNLSGSKAKSNSTGHNFFSNYGDTVEREFIGYSKDNKKISTVTYVININKKCKVKYYKKSFTVKEYGWRKSSSEKKYYINKDGYIVTGFTKIKDKNNNDKWYYFNSNGVMQTGWQKINGKFHYFKTNGVMTTGWLKINGKRYYLNESGEMVVYLQKINDNYYYFNGKGEMQTGFIRFNKDGKYRYFYVKTNKSLNKTAGQMAAGIDVKINGEIYKFDSNGICIRGSKCGITTTKPNITTKQQTSTTKSYIDE